MNALKKFWQRIITKQPIIVETAAGTVTFPPKNNRIWGKNEDGTPYIAGMTVAELRKGLDLFQDSDEVCVTVCRKKEWNGGGLVGKLKAITNGSDGQIWLKAFVLDKSQE